MPVMIHGASPLAFKRHGDFFTKPLRVCEGQIRLYAGLKREESERRAVCIVEVPRDVVFVELLSAVCGREAWIDALLGVSLVRGDESYAAILDFGGSEEAIAAFLAACAMATFALPDEEEEAETAVEQQPRVSACRALVVDLRHFERSAPPLIFGKRRRLQRHLKADLTTSLRALAVRAAGLRELPSCAVCLDRLEVSATLLEARDVAPRRGPSPDELPLRGRWPRSRCLCCAVVAASSEPDSNRQRLAEEEEEEDEHYGPLSSMILFSRRPLRCQSVGCCEEASLWSCLVCGYVGCGRYRKEHAKLHFHATDHGFAIELETRRIWDYINDSYVHRLNKPRRSLTINNHERQRDLAAYHENNEDDDDDEYDYDGDNVDCANTPSQFASRSEKFSALAAHYEAVLEAQLAEQRAHYDERATTAEAAARAVSSALGARDEEIVGRHRAALDCARAEAASLTALCSAATDDLRDLRAENLVLAKAAKAARDTTRETRELATSTRNNGVVQLRELEAQIRDVEFALGARSQLGEAQGGTVLLVQPNEPQNSSRNNHNNNNHKLRRSGSGRKNK